MAEIEMTRLAADLSVRGMRERAFARECVLIAQREERKADWTRRRAGRLALKSNGRRKLILRAAALEEHAGLMRAAAQAREAA